MGNHKFTFRFSSRNHPNLKLTIYSTLQLSSMSTHSQPKNKQTHWTVKQFLLIRIKWLKREFHIIAYTVGIPSWNWHHSLRQNHRCITWRALPARTGNKWSSGQGPVCNSSLSCWRMDRRINSRTTKWDHHIWWLRVVEFTSASKLALSRSQIISTFNLILQESIKQKEIKIRIW